MFGQKTLPDQFSTFLFAITFFLTVFIPQESKAQSLAQGDLSLIGWDADSDTLLVVALDTIPSGETVFFTDKQWNGSAFISSEGTKSWLTPQVNPGTVIALSASGASVGGTVSQISGTFNIASSGDGVFLYQTDNNSSTGNPTFLSFMGRDSSYAGTFANTGLSNGIYAALTGANNAVYNGTRTGFTKSSFLEFLYLGYNWNTSSTPIAFDTTYFSVNTCGSAGDVSFLSAVSSDNEAHLFWDNSTCFDQVLVVARESSAVSVSPSGNGTSYLASSIFSNGTQLSAGEYIVYFGNGSAVDIQGLTNNSTYHFKVFTRLGSDWSSGVSVDVTPGQFVGIWDEPFDNNTQFSVTTGGMGNDGSADYFQITDGSNIDKDYSEISGDFLAGQDVDDGGWAGSASPSQLTWSGIYIEDLTDLVFSVDIASDGAGFMDASDAFLIEYRIDGGSWTNLMAFNNEGTGVNTYFLRDHDFNGTGTGALLYSKFQTFYTSISSTGSAMDIRLTMSINAGGEDLAVDNLYLRGQHNGLVFSENAWTPNQPNSSTGTLDVLILDDGAQITADAEVENFKVPHGSVELTSGTDLTVNGYFHNNGEITVKDGASIIQTSVADLNAAGSGSYIIERDGLNDSTDYNLWSSPISSATLTSVFTGSNHCDMFVFDEVIQDWRYDFQLGTSWSCLGNTGTWSASNLATNGADGIMDISRGYLMPGSPSNNTRSFTGEINNGTYTYSIVETDSVTDPSSGGNDWNLIGNPYPSAISLDDFLSTNYNGGAGDITNAVYFYVRSGGSLTSGQYETYTSGDNIDIGSAQGFFVEALNDGTVSFTNAMRDGDNTTFRSSSNNHQVAYFHLEGNGLSDAFRVFIDANASDGVDYVYDISKMYNWNGFNAYTSFDDRDFVFQSIEPINFNQSKRIPLGFEIPTDGAYTLVLDSTKGDWDNLKLLLRDKENQTLQLVSDLSAINLNANTYENRFELLIQRVLERAPDEGEDLLAPPDSNITGVESVASNQVVIIPKNKAAELISDASIKSCSVYDLSGRLIHDAKVNQSNYFFRVDNHGVYIVQVLLQNGLTETRKVAL